MQPNIVATSVAEGPEDLRHVFNWSRIGCFGAVQPELFIVLAYYDLEL